MSPAPFGELDDVLRLLKKMGLAHALIGGWAVITWGFLRASDDLDLMIELPVSRRKELLDALAADVAAEGVTIPVVRPEDLIAMKLEAGGGQDFEDVRRLLSVLAGKLDELLLKESCSARRVDDRLALCRADPTKVE
ncbi:MAG: hypothetical protein ACHQ49_02275 [Elusimicrobiota bacterium]